MWIGSQSFLFLHNTFRFALFWIKQAENIGGDLGGIRCSDMVNNSIVLSKIEKHCSSSSHLIRLSISPLLNLSGL